MIPLASPRYPGVSGFPQNQQTNPNDLYPPSLRPAVAPLVNNSFAPSQNAFGTPGALANPQIASNSIPFAPSSSIGAYGNLNLGASASSYPSVPLSNQFLQPPASPMQMRSPLNFQPSPMLSSPNQSRLSNDSILQQSSAFMPQQMGQLNLPTGGMAASNSGLDIPIASPRVQLEQQGVKQLRERVEQLESELTKKDSRINELEVATQIGPMQKKLQLALEENRSLRKLCDDLQVQMRSLDQRSLDSLELQSQHQTQIDTMSARHAELEGIITELHEQKTECEDDIRLLEDKLSAYGLLLFYFFI